MSIYHLCLTLLIIFHRLERFTQADLTKAEEFIKCLQVLYTSTLCVSSEKSPTCSQIIPILTKLEAHFKQCDEDTNFISSIKERVWDDLQNRYQVFYICRQYISSIIKRRGGHSIFNIRCCIIFPFSYRMKTFRTF